MLCRYFMLVPVHTGKIRTKHLHSVHANIARTAIWLFGMNDWKCYKRPAIFWPAGNNRKFGNVGIVFDDYLLTVATAAAHLRHPACKLTKLWQHFQFINYTFLW